ncbi:MAG: aminodeoxychorismate lyase [Gammaproteobacteria bacterium]|nr:MAG: aminodeoxychorismate lyase [Gammaproteobacteria bacterium]
MTETLINGRPGDSIPVTDRGFGYADGLFETIAVRGGQPRLLHRHLARLRAGCERLGIIAPLAVLAAEIERLARGRARAILRVAITRGSGPRGYRPPADGSALRAVTLYPAGDAPRAYWRDGVRVIRCRTPAATSPAIAGLKTLGRLEQVLARAEWDDPAIAEGLMRNADGWIGGTRSNLFLVRQGRLYTPRLVSAGVAGVMRGLVIEQARRLGRPAAEVAVDDAQLESADELFLTNSQFGIWPVRQLGGRTLSSGPLTRALMQALADEGVEECAA